MSTEIADAVPIDDDAREDDSTTSDHDCDEDVPKKKYPAPEDMKAGDHFGVFWDALAGYKDGYMRRQMCVQLVLTEVMPTWRIVEQEDKTRCDAVKRSVGSKIDVLIKKGFVETNDSKHIRLVEGKERPTAEGAAAIFDNKPISLEPAVRKRSMECGVSKKQVKKAGAVSVSGDALRDLLNEELINLVYELKTAKDDGVGAAVMRTTKKLCEILSMQ